MASSFGAGSVYRMAPVLLTSSIGVSWAKEKTTIMGGEHAQDVFRNFYEDHNLAITWGRLR